MLDKITNSQTREELFDNLDEVYTELGQQVPKSFIEKLDEWRYFSMLFNPKTHIRNMVGNFFMARTMGVKNIVGGVIEAGVSRLPGMKNMERTKTIVPSSKGVKQFAREDALKPEVQGMLGADTSKFDRPSNAVLDKQVTFANKTAEKYVGGMFKFGSNLLEAEDTGRQKGFRIAQMGLIPLYEKYLANYMTANKLTAENITEEQLGKARDYAVKEALEGTFHQASVLANTLQQVSKKHKGIKFLLDARVPFLRTPINVAKMGVQYSPVNILNSISRDIYRLHKGDITVNEYIDNLSKGLTGVGIAWIGYNLARLGVLKASGDDDKDKEYYNQQQGHQPYSINIAGKNYSLDWVTPSGIPLFIGAETYELSQRQKKENEGESDIDTATALLNSFGNVVNAGSKMLNPMTEMSMVSGIAEMFDEISNTDNDTEKLSALAFSSVSTYVNQYFPTVLGQISKTFDDYERTTTSTKPGTLPKIVDSTWNQIKLKIPGLRQTLPVRTDEWGNDVKTVENLPLRALYNFASPTTVKNISTDEVDKGLNELYEQVGDKSILPGGIKKVITINGKDYRFNNQDYQKYKKEYGQTSHAMIQEMMNTDEYKSLNDTEKAEAISNVYRYVNEKIKQEYAEQKGQELEKSTSYRTIESLQDAGVSTSDITKYMSKYENIEADYDDDGNVISGSQANKRNKWLLESDLSDNAKEVIYENRVGSDESYKKFKGNINTYLKFKTESYDRKKEGKSVTQDDKIKTLIKGKYTNKERQQLYDTFVSDDDYVYKALKKSKVNMKEYLKYKQADLKADKLDDGTINGKTISGSAKAKKMAYINSMNITYEQKLLLMGSSYKMTQAERTKLFNYVNGLNISGKDKMELYAKLKGFTVYKDGRVTW